MTSKKTIFLLTGCLAGGGVTGYVFLEPNLPIFESRLKTSEADAISNLGNFETLTLPPILVSVKGLDPQKQLRLEVSVQTGPEDVKDVETRVPLYVDVIAQYFRSLETYQIDRPGEILELRSQILRRLQTVSGPASVSDIFITKFLIG